MRTLTEAIDFIDTNYPQEFIVNNRFISTDIFISGPMPKYLYRGESQLWQTTQSTASRKGIQNDPDFTEINYWITGRHPIIGAVLNRHCLYNFLRESLYGVSIIEDHYDNPDMDKAIAALLQHYGFDTALVDFTSDLTVAAFFASSNSSAGSVGRIFVLPTKGIENFLFDLSLDKAYRPRKQKAFALILPMQYDLKKNNTVSFQDELTIEFHLTAHDKEKYFRNDLLSVLDDEVVIDLHEWFDCHIASNSRISENVKKYFKNKMDALR